MSEITAKQIQDLRKKTGVGIMDAKKALIDNQGNIDKAIIDLRKRGEKISQSKADRSTKQGIVETYLHSNKRIASVVVLLCETDFVAKTEDFKELAHQIALQIAATQPKYLAPEDIPAKEIDEEKEIFEQQIDKSKPANMKEKIIAGKLDKMYQERCLIKQIYIKDDKLKIEDLLKQTVAKLGENIKIKSFGFFEV